MTKLELLNIKGIKLEIKLELAKERELILDLFKFYVNTGNSKSSRYTKQLDKLHKEILAIEEEIEYIEQKIMKGDYDEQVQN